MTCPICGNGTVHRFRPFCSKRCADIDLGKWMRGDYALPSDDPEDIERAEEALDQAGRQTTLKTGDFPLDTPRKPRLERRDPNAAPFTRARVAQG